MRVNLAEGCGTVNCGIRVRSSKDARKAGRGQIGILPLLACLARLPILRVSQISPISFGELCSWDAFLYKNDCAGH